MSPPTCRRCHVRDAAFRGSRSTRRKIGWLVRNVESNVESLRAFFLVTCSPRDKRSGRWIRREDEGGRRKGRDFGAVQVLFSFIAEAQPVARFAACFTIYTFVSRTDDKRSSSPRVAIARREMGRGGKKSALFERNEGRNRCNGPRFDAQWIRLKSGFNFPRKVCSLRFFMHFNIIALRPVLPSTSERIWYLSRPFFFPFFEGGERGFLLVV